MCFAGERENWIQLQKAHGLACDRWSTSSHWLLTRRQVPEASSPQELVGPCSSHTPPQHDKPSLFPKTTLGRFVYCMSPKFHPNSGDFWKLTVQACSVQWRGSSGVRALNKPITSQSGPSPSQICPELESLSIPGWLQKPAKQALKCRDWSNEMT